MDSLTLLRQSRALFTSPAKTCLTVAIAASCLLSSAFAPLRAAPAAPTATTASAKDNSAVDATLKKVVALSDDGKADAAVELGNQAIKSAPDYWLPHAVVSVVEWRRNRYQNGLKEAKEALRLSPDAAILNLNFAIMNQQLGYFETSIPGFRKAAKAAPNDWVPRLGLMQALYGTSNTPEALSVLDQMSTKTDANYDWWYHLAIGYSNLKKPKQSADAAQHAVATATTPEQKAGSKAMLLTELVLANELDKAHAIQSEVLDSKTKRGDVYTSCLSSLCDAKDPSYGRTIIDTAVNATTGEAEDYFKLGQIAEQKASTPGLDANTRNAWLDDAEIAYKNAVQILPRWLKPVLGLASVYDRKGRKDDMFAMLTKAKSIAPADPLTPYLMAKVKASGNDLAGRLRETLTGEPEKPYQLNLIKEEFQLDNLSCNCHLNTVVFQLRQENGIKFAVITSREKPIKGMLLADQTYGSAEAMANAAKVEGKLSAKTLDSAPVLTVSDAIRLTLETPDAMRDLSTLSFTTEPPKMPAI